MEYLDFDIEVEPGTDGGYDVSVVHSPAGEARGQMRFPYDRLALRNRIQALQIALLRSGGRRRAVSAEDRAVEELGRDLFESLFSGDIASRLHVSRTIARREGRGVRIKLRISAPELLGLPWEYLYDSTGGDYLALAVTTPVVRYLPIAQPIVPLEVTPPLRILAMTAGPRDLGELDAARERQRLELAIERLRARGLVELKWVDGESWEALQEALWAGPWHVFHFVGHGGFSERRGTGVLYLTGDDGNARELAAGDLARLLGDHDPLRLALLNSCETAQGTDTDIFSSTAAALVRRGTPAVVAMQFQITDDAAIQFSRVFYAATAHGMPVDSAVAEARKSVALQVANTYEWGTPVLFMRTPDGVLFRIPRVDEPAGEAPDVSPGALRRPPEPIRAPAVPAEQSLPIATASTAADSQPAAASTPPRPEAPAPTRGTAVAAVGAQPAPARPAVVPAARAGTAPRPTTPARPAPPPPPPPRPAEPATWSAAQSTAQPGFSAVPYPGAHTWSGPPGGQTRPASLPRRRIGLLSVGAVAVLITVLFALASLWPRSDSTTPAVMLGSSLSVTPAEVQPGDAVTVIGEDFAPGEEVIVSWANGRDAQNVRADDAGSFGLTMIVPPNARQGERLLMAVNSSGERIEQSLTVVDLGGPDELLPVDPDGDLEPPDAAVSDAVCAFQVHAVSAVNRTATIDELVRIGSIDEAWFEYDSLSLDAALMHDALATAGSWEPLADVASRYRLAIDEYLLSVEAWISVPSEEFAALASERTDRLFQLGDELNMIQSAHPELGQPCW